MRLAAAFTAFLALAGCAELRPGPNHAAALDAIVGEAVNAARAPAAEQKATLVRAQQANAEDSSPSSRLRVAVLLATLPPPLRDEQRAAQLLEPLADSSAPGIGRFSAMLSGQLAERQRLARELERVSREAERSTRERERLDRERERLDKERDKREETLRQQLEALRAIERGILEREEKLRRRQR